MFFFHTFFKMAEEVSMNNVDTHASEDETQLNSDEILISFSVQDNTTSISEESMRITTFRVQRNALINSPIFVSDLLVLAFTPGSLDNELIQSISVLARSMRSEQHHMIVHICVEPDKHKIDFAFEKVKVEDLKEIEKCVICLEEFLSGSEVSRMPCSHVYHEDCIYRWLEKSGSCPLCRYHMNPS